MCSKWFEKVCNYTQVDLAWRDPIGLICNIRQIRWCFGRISISISSKVNGIRSKSDRIIGVVANATSFFCWLRHLLFFTVWRSASYKIPITWICHPEILVTLSCSLCKTVWCTLPWNLFSIPLTCAVLQKSLIDKQKCIEILLCFTSNFT